MDHQQLRIDISPKLVLVDVFSDPTRRDRELWTKDTDLVSRMIVLRSNYGDSKSSNYHWNRKILSQSLLQSAVVPCVHHRKSHVLSLVPQMEVIRAICCPGYLNMSFLSHSQREETVRYSMRTSSFEESQGKYCKISRTNRELSEVIPGVDRGQELRWNTDLELSYSMWETRNFLSQEI